MDIKEMPMNYEPPDIDVGGDEPDPASLVVLMGVVLAAVFSTVGATVNAIINVNGIIWETDVFV